MRILFFFMIFVMTACVSLQRRASVIDFPAEALEQAADESVPLRGTIPQKWWELFDDCQLASFIETAFQNNPTIHDARARIIGALYGANQVRSGLFPFIEFGGDILREKLSETGLIPFNQKSTQTGANAPLPVPAGMNGIPVYFTQVEMEFTLNYDFDIWDKRRNTLKAALGEVQARIADDAFIHLEIGIALAKLYFQLQVNYQREEIANAFLDNEIRIFKMTEGLVVGHLNNALSTSTLDARVADAKVALAQIQEDIAVKEAALRAYLANGFDDLIISMPISRQILPQIPMPTNIPLHLLANRPDIAAELWLIESRGKEIEVAKAGFYPDFNISALFGYQTIHLHKLFEWPSSFYNIDPAFTLPIFTGGLLEANLGASEVNYDRAIYRYNQLVIDATKEVLEALAALRYSQQINFDVQSKLQTQGELNMLTTLRFQNNIDSELNVLQSQQTVLRAKDQELISLGNILQSQLLLIKALGGGYNCP